MDEAQIQEIADRVIAALESMSPGTNWPVLIAAVLAFLIGLFTLRQKSQADARSEWWSRTQWALEATVAADKRLFTYGYEILEIQGDSNLAGPEELDLLDAVWKQTKSKMEAEQIRQLLETSSGYLPTDQQRKVSSFRERVARFTGRVAVDDSAKPSHNEDERGGNP